MTCQSSAWQCSNPSQGNGLVLSGTTVFRRLVQKCSTSGRGLPSASVCIIMPSSSAPTAIALRCVFPSHDAPRLISQLKLSLRGASIVRRMAGDDALVRYVHA
ncbi:hypothetical protein AMELA_G00049520 [Ameiurus melas]|uniref:Uncharacterized protein n=1 Tax=Ameiurus melas TaxID=219545 RepID=A0A7J6B585_AMEME|nr:hypothetical protein AMELA_G00049520 [Ameiurus melas]